MNHPVNPWKPYDIDLTLPLSGNGDEAAMKQDTIVMRPQLGVSLC